jgi:protein FRG1
LELPAESKSALKKARKEGRLAEELLDRRSKIKSDRYAKVCITPNTSPFFLNSAGLSVLLFKLIFPLFARHQ